MMKQFIEAGEFVTTHGVTGELKLAPWSDGPEFIKKLPRLFFTPQGGQETKVISVRIHKDMCLVKLEGVESIEDARRYIRHIAYFSRDDVKLPAGRYYQQDIIGCTVKDAQTGEEYGTITEIEHPGACDIYDVKNSKGEVFLFPAVPEFLDTLSPETGVVTVRPIPGMFTNEGGNDDED